MLSLGSSKHWTHALKLLTGEDTITADALLEYFQPLHDWLITENSKYPDERVGWMDGQPSLSNFDLLFYAFFSVFVFILFLLLFFIFKLKFYNYFRASDIGYSLVLNENEPNTIGTNI
jgi:hypothetical protein